MTARAAIVIAAWNAEATLERAARSALAQTAPVEVVVVDDASTDGTAAVAHRLAAADGRLTVLTRSRNGGPGPARNAAIAASRAPWITVLDADDFMEPGRIAALLEIAEAEALDFLADDVFKVREDDVEGPRTRLWSATDFGALDVDAAAFVTANLSSHRGGRREMGFVKPLMRRRFLEEHGLTYADMRLAEDYDLYTRALIRGARFRLIDPRGYVAVWRTSSLSGDHATEDHKAIVDADLRLLATPDLTAETRAAVKAHLMEQRKMLAWRRMIDAVRARSVSGAVACCWAHPAVLADLAGRLGEQVMLRAGRRLSGSRGRRA